MRALPDGTRGKAIGHLTEIVARSSLESGLVAKFIGDTPSGLLSRWPIERMLEDSASVASTKAFGKVLNETLKKTNAGGYRWGGYHEIYIGASLKRRGYHLVEFDQNVPKFGSIPSTDIDIITTKLDPTTGQTVTFFYHAKATVAAYGGGQNLYQQDYKKWLKTATGKAAAWNQKVKNVDGQAKRIWTHSDGQPLPNELAELMAKLQGAVKPIDWPGL